MLKRLLLALWLALSIPWAAMVLYAGSTEPDGIGTKIIVLALFPFAIGLILARVGRWVWKG